MMNNRSELHLKLLLYNHCWGNCGCLDTYNNTLDFSEQKIRKNTILQQFSRHDATTTAEDAPGRVGRGKRGDARPENSPSRSVLELGLSRRRLGTTSKSDPSLLSCSCRNPEKIRSWIMDGRCSKPSSSSHQQPTAANSSQRQHAEYTDRVAASGTTRTSTPRTGSSRQQEAAGPALASNSQQGHRQPTIGSLLQRARGSSKSSRSR